MATADDECSHLLKCYSSVSFSLVLCLTGCQQDQAFSTVADSFVDSLRFPSSNGVFSPSDRIFLRTLLGSLLERCRTLQAGAFNLSGLEEQPPAKRHILRVVKEALFALSFDSRALLLLRDQANLAYADIAAVLSLSVKDVKVAVCQARIQLRDKVNEVMEHAGRR